MTETTTPTVIESMLPALEHIEASELPIFISIVESHVGDQYRRLSSELDDKIASEQLSVLAENEYENARVLVEITPNA